jgi:hypothetical protein
LLQHDEFKTLVNGVFQTPAFPTHQELQSALPEIVEFMKRMDFDRSQLQRKFDDIRKQETLDNNSTENTASSTAIICSAIILSADEGLVDSASILKNASATPVYEFGNKVHRDLLLQGEDCTWQLLSPIGASQQHKAPGKPRLCFMKMNRRKRMRR